MSSRRDTVQHKECLPAQSRIKRRRVDTTAGTSCNEGDATSESGTKEGQMESAKEVDRSTTLVGHQGSNPSPSSSQPSTDSDTEGDDEDIEKENARLAELRSKMQQPSSPVDAVEMGRVGSYNHDVLYRRGDWRNRATQAPSKSDKWKTVLNSKQHSVVYQHFMQKHFK